MWTGKLEKNLYKILSYELVELIHIQTNKKNRQEQQKNNIDFYGDNNRGKKHDNSTNEK